MKLIDKPHGLLRDALQSLKQGLRAANRHRLYRRRMKRGVAYAEWIAAHDTPSAQDKAAWQDWLNKHADDLPLVALVLFVDGDGDNAGQLQRCIDSVRQQIYPRWQLLVQVDAAGRAAHRSILEKVGGDDPRIHVSEVAAGTPIDACMHQALRQSSDATWIGLLRSGDQLREQSLILMIQAVMSQPDARLIYPDQDCITPAGQRFNHHFKPDWNPDFLRSSNYIGHACLISQPHLSACIGKAATFSAFMFDTVLRCTEQLAAHQIVHVPHVLWHLGTDNRSAASPQALRALQSHLDRTSPGASADRTPEGFFHVRYPVAQPVPLVSIVICTRNQYKLLQTCIQSITEKTSYSPYEIIVVDNGSDEQRTLDYLKQVGTSDPRIRVIRDDSPFNYAALNNMAVAHARGELVALLNNDIEVIDGDWLSEMVGHALRPDIGCVGAKLLYPDDTVQHAGVLVGSGSDAPDAIAAHYLRGIPRDAPGYANRAIVTHQLSAVTAACLVIRKNTFLQVGGLDAEHLAVTYNDVDFCLRVGDMGLRQVWTPHAMLYHHESVSRGRDASSKNIARFLPELAYMKKRWSTRLKRDPCYNPNLSHAKPDFLLVGQHESS